VWSFLLSVFYIRGCLRYLLQLPQMQMLTTRTTLGLLSETLLLLVFSLHAVDLFSAHPVLRNVQSCCIWFPNLVYSVMLFAPSIPVLQGELVGKQ